MNKYIVEIKPEYEDSFKGLMILGAKDSNLFVDTLAVDDLEQLNSDYINKHYGQLQDDAYQRGLDDAWEAARELYLNGACKDLFGEYFNTFIKNHTAQEAIEKLKAHKHNDKIEVGDMVRHDRGWTAVVTSIDNVGFSVMDYNGNVASYSDISKFTKTGRHFDIDKILEEMKK